MERDRPLILQQPIQGFYILHFSSFCFRRGFYLPFPNRSSMAPTACAWRRHLRDAVPNSNPGLAIRTLNIRYRWGFGLEQAIQTVERGFFDIMLLTKTKIQSETYSHNRLVYDVNCLTVRLSSSRGSQGGVELVMRERPLVRVAVALLGAGRPWWRLWTGGGGGSPACAITERTVQLVRLVPRVGVIWFLRRL